MIKVGMSVWVWCWGPGVLMSQAHLTTTTTLESNIGQCAALVQLFWNNSDIIKTFAHNLMKISILFQIKLFAELWNNYMGFITL